MAEINGYDRSLNTMREDTLIMVLQQLFPNASDISDAHFWTGLRPATPDGTPIVGKQVLKIYIPIQDMEHWVGRCHAVLLSYYQILFLRRNLRLNMMI